MMVYRSRWRSRRCFYHADGNWGLDYDTSILKLRTTLYGMILTENIMMMNTQSIEMLELKQLVNMII